MMVSRGRQLRRFLVIMAVLAVIVAVVIILAVIEPRALYLLLVAAFAHLLCWLIWESCGNDWSDE